MASHNAPVLMGHVAGVYGIKGWLKIVSYTRPQNNILGYSPWYLQDRETLDEYNVRDSATSAKGLRVALDGVDDRNTATDLVGREIYIQRDQLEPLPEGQYYWADLLNLQVVNRDGENLGVLQEIYETGANDVMVIQGAERHLVPLIWKQYVLDVDLERGIIRVDWQ